jgi:hypothetical protein
VWQKSSSMPSFGGEVKYVSHVPALRHVKEPSNFVNYGLLAKSLALVPSFASREVSHTAWCAAPLEINNGTPLGG